MASQRCCSLRTLCACTHVRAVGSPGVGEAVGEVVKERVCARLVYGEEAARKDQRSRVDGCSPVLSGVRCGRRRTL